MSKKKSVVEKIQDALATYKTSSRDLVVAYESLLDNFANSMDAQHLAASLNAFKEFPRLQKKAVSLTRILCKVKIEETKTKGKYSVCNGVYSNLTKNKKAERKAEVVALVAEFKSEQHQSLMNHGSEDGGNTKPFNLTGKAANLYKTTKNQMENKDYAPTAFELEILGILKKAQDAIEAAKAKAAKKEEASEEEATEATEEETTEASE